MNAAIIEFVGGPIDGCKMALNPEQQWVEPRTIVYVPTRSTKINQELLAPTEPISVIIHTYEINWSTKKARWKDCWKDKDRCEPQ